jgi:hypothetical protein
MHIRGCITTSAVLALSVSACAVTIPARYEAVYSWVDRDIGELVGYAGMPDGVFLDGVDGWALVYETLPACPRSAVRVTDEQRDQYYDQLYAALDERAVPPLIAAENEILFVDSRGSIYAIQSNSSQRSMRTQWENNLLVGGVIAGILTLAAIIVLANQE